MARLRIPPFGHRRWPFAVGAVVHPEPRPDSDSADGAGISVSDAFWADRHLAVALAAYEAGFYLLATVDVGPGGGITGLHREQLRTLVERTDAEALFVLGLAPDEREAMELLGADLRLVMRDVQPVDGP